MPTPESAPRALTFRILTFKVRMLLIWQRLFYGVLLSHEILIFHNTVLMKHHLRSLHMIKKLNAYQGRSVEIRAWAQQLLETVLSFQGRGEAPLFSEIDSWIQHSFLQQMCSGWLCFPFALFLGEFGTGCWFPCYTFFYTLDVCWCRMEVW